MLSLDWLKEEKLVEVRSMLKFQKLDQFLNLTGNTYPGLVKVFLTNMWYDDEFVYSQVKGIDFAINEEVWMNVTGLNNEEVVVTGGNSADLEGFNKVQFTNLALEISLLCPKHTMLVVYQQYPEFWLTLSSGY